MSGGGEFSHLYPVMKRFFLGACLTLLVVEVSVPAIAADALDLIRIWPEYRDDSMLLRLSDYFRRGKDTARSDYQRTEPDVRAGMYFTVRLRTGTAAPISDGTVRLHVIAPDASEPRTFDFPFQARGQSNLKLELGLTGKDWTYGNVLPTAWRLEVLDGENTVVASHNSFLWQ